MQEEVEVMTTQDEMAADLTTFTMIFANVERWGYNPLIGFETEKNTVNLFACTECGNVVAVRGQQQEFTAQTNPLVIHATHCMGTTLGIRMVRARAKATEAVEGPQIESSQATGGRPDWIGTTDEKSESPFRQPMHSCSLTYAELAAGRREPSCAGCARLDAHAEDLPYSQKKGEW